MKSDPVRLGSIVLHPRMPGVLPAILPTMIRVLDSDPWIRDNWQDWWPYWHMSWVCGLDDDGWIVRNVSGNGVTYPHLDSFPGPLVIVNWLPELTPADCRAFDKHFPCRGYDVIGYAFCAMNRLSRGLFPAIQDKNLYCWEDIANLAYFFGRPWMPFGEMAYMPLFVKAWRLRGTA